MSCLNVEVSIYKNAFDREGDGTITLLDFFDNEEYRPEIEKIRSLHDPEKIKGLKKTLPCITVSGRFSTRQSNGLIQHSKFIGIDIDAKDNSHLCSFNDLYKPLCQIPNVAYCGRSVYSGFFVLIPIVYPEKHKEQFKALQTLFKARFNIVVDPACSDITRLRTISYSVPRHFNHHAIPFSGVMDHPVGELHHTRINRRPARIRGDLRRCLNDIVELQLDITGNAYDWFKIGCAIACEYGENGRNIFHLISSNYKNSRFAYNAVETDKIYNQCLNSGKKYTLGTFFYYYNRVFEM